MLKKIKCENISLISAGHASKSSPLEKGSFPITREVK